MVGDDFFGGVHSNSTQTGVHQTSNFVLPLQAEAGEGQSVVVGAHVAKKSEGYLASFVSEQM